MPPELSLYKPQDWPALLSTAQVADLLSVGRETIHAMLARGEINGVRVGRRWRIAADDVWPFVPASIRSQWPEGPWRELA
ncbi:MAG: Helix-turn-helix domain [Thermoleophilaceae bacterium]|nr:Helix-turn-helix domain [Thermoleophilaceae bacterium]